MSTLFCSNTEITPYMERLARYCDDRLDLQKAELNDEYFYQSLPLCVIDSVYSIGVKYEGTRNTVKKYCDYYGLRRIRKDRTALPERGMQESLKEFLDKLKSSGIDFFADQVFRNRQRTSTRSGILKCEAVFKFAQCLHRYGVDCFQDIHHVVHEKRFENEIKSIPGQASGISLSYFFMLSGSDDLIKPDRWIIDFIKDALGVTCSPSCAQTVLVGSCEILKAQYPTVSPRLLDNTIWKHQTGKKDKKTRQRALT